MAIKLLNPKRVIIKPKKIFKWKVFYMLEEYIQNLNRLLKTGVTTEHSFRGDLQNLLNLIIDDKNIIVTNEPKRIVDVGAPDFSVSRDGVPIGYIEAKDIDKNIEIKCWEAIWKV